MGAFKGRTEVQAKGPKGTTALYGWTRNSGNTLHGGIDITCPDCPPDNTPVLAVQGGKVVQSRIVNNGVGKGTAEWGHYVTILTNSGFYDIYAHLESRALKVGDRVVAGSLVGVMGNSGNAKGGYKHLHFERRKTATGTGIDPSAVLGIQNAVGIYGSKNENNNQEDDNVKMKICRPMGKELSSQLRLENANAIAGRKEKGNLMAYTSDVAREYTADTLSQVKDEMVAQMKDGDLLIFTD